ncbi:hypothetical protein ACSSV4_000998 [Roseovarius sp. MBR-154]|jgi:hypothetical protein
MTHLSNHDLWGNGGNSVTALPPSPGDVLVVTTLFGRRVLVHPIHEYDRVLRIADAFARRLRHRHPVALKVLCLSLTEAQRMGLAPDGMFQDQTPEEEAQMRQLVVTTCLEVLRDSDDAKVRADAMRLVKELGVVAQ